MEKFGLIGYPLKGSGSPALFASAYGGKWNYDLIENPDFETAWGIFLEGYRAINITAPFKEAAFRKMAETGTVDAGCRELGAINIAVKTPEGIKGWNSDYLGVLKILKEKGFGKGKTALCIGFGGAGRAAAAAAGAAGMDTVICNRSIKAPGMRPLQDIPILAAVSDLIIYSIPFPVPEMEGVHVPALLEANYRTPSYRGAADLYIPGEEWLKAQADTGYPLMVQGLEHKAAHNF